MLSVLEKYKIKCFRKFKDRKRLLTGRFTESFPEGDTK